PEKLETELARVDGVARVDKLNWILARAHGQRVVVIARTFDPEARPAIDLTAGEPRTVVRGLLQGETVVGNALAQRLHVGIGDQVQVDTRDGPRSLRIVGTAN